MNSKNVIMIVFFLSMMCKAQLDEVGCATYYPEDISDWTQKGGKYLPSTGSLKVLVVFAKFKDDLSQHQHWPVDSYPLERNEFIDSSTDRGSTHYLNLTNYFRQMSFGNFLVTGQSVTAETPYPIDHYIPEEGSYPVRSLANRDILETIDDYIDYRAFDNWTYLSNYYHKNEPDGIVDMIIVIWRGLVFSDNWCGEASLGRGDEFFVEENQLRIRMGFGGCPGYGTYGSGVTIQYWGERSRERNFKVVIHEIAHWLISSEHPYNYFNHTFWGMLTLASEGICINSFEREKVAWVYPFLIENTILAAPMGDYVTTPTIYKYHPQNGYLNEMFYFENHQRLSIYDDATSNSTDKGIFILHFAHGYYIGDCVRIIASNGFWDWESPDSNLCWKNYLPSYKVKNINRKGYGNRDRIISPDSRSEFLYSFMNEYNQVECNDFLHGFKFINTFNTKFNDLFSPWSNPPSYNWDGKSTNFSLQVLNEYESVVTVIFVVDNSLGLKPSKPFLGWDPNFPDTAKQNGWIYLAWGADFWDGAPIEPDVNYSELQRSTNSDGWITVYRGQNRIWSDSSGIYSLNNSDTVFFRVRVRDSQMLWSMWSETFNTKMKLQIITSSEIEFENSQKEPLSDHKLFQNHPNPFNLNTKIKYSVTQSSQVHVKVFDVLGNEIETLVSEEKPAGTYELNWHAASLPSGVYFYKLEAGEFIQTRKMILIK